MLNRSNAIARERGRIAGELQSAKAVQDVLMPKELVTIPAYPSRAYTGRHRRSAATSFTYARSRTDHCAW